MEFKISLARVTGSDHGLHNIPCRDKTAVFAGDDYTTAALADGAGSRPYSHIGAELATVAVASKLYVRFEDFWEYEPHMVATGAWVEATNAMLNEPYSLYDQACTLLFVAIAEDGRYISGHIGDGVQILVDPNGEMRTFSPPENGEYENETWFITGDDAVEHLRIQKGTLQAGSTLLMMSDGTAKSLYQTSTGEPAPACRTIARWLKEKEEDEVSFLLEKNMNEVFWSRTSDDMSLIVIRVQEKQEGHTDPNLLKL